MQRKPLPTEKKTTTRGSLLACEPDSQQKKYQNLVCRVERLDKISKIWILTAKEARMSSSVKSTVAPLTKPNDISSTTILAPSRSNTLHARCKEFESAIPSFEHTLHRLRPHSLPIKCRQTGRQSQDREEEGYLSSSFCLSSREKL